MNASTRPTMLILLLVTTIARPASTEGTTRPEGRARLDGLELEYDVRGAGEAVVLVHAGVFANWYQPLLEEPSLAGRYRVLTYRRVGYPGSSRLTGTVSLSRQAAHLAALRRQRG